jgi:hypothetical protein
MSLSPETTAATTVTNRPDIVTKPSFFQANPQQNASDFVNNSTRWSQPGNETVSGEEFISLSMGNSDAILYTSHALNISPAILEKL